MTKVHGAEQGEILDSFRYSGEAILTWFYTPENLMEDMMIRSTLKGYLWEDILNYDFVFKVTGQKIRPVSMS